MRIFRHYFDARCTPHSLSPKRGDEATTPPYDRDDADASRASKRFFTLLPFSIIFRLVYFRALMWRHFISASFMLQAYVRI